MREVKFRGWDGKVMFPAEDLSVSPGERLWLGHTDMTLLQYTGLKDKNGVEIYEGDILYWDGSVIGAVVFGNAEYVVGEGVNARNLCNAPVEEIKVIGNIYENPELLGKAMKQIIEIPKGHTLIEVEGGYQIVSVDEDWPQVGNKCWHVDSEGLEDWNDWVSDNIDLARKDFHNIFRTKKQAKCAAKLRVLTNALTAAKAIVEPEFEPDWSDPSQDKHIPYCDKKWFLLNYPTFQFRNDVYSTPKKGMEAIALLEKWGVME